MFDTHSHLFEPVFANDLNECILRAKKIGVKKCMLVGFSHETNYRAYELAQTDPAFFYSSCGIHPSEVAIKIEENLQELKDFMQAHRVYALGEIGLDYHYENISKGLQKKYFEEQIKLAIEFNLPIIVHMRDATKDTYDILKKYQGQVTGVMHCYSGSYEMALEFISLGFYISLAGPVTFKNAKEPKEIAAKIPLERLLIETDCPYLAPTPFRGQRNETAYVQKIAAEVARLREMDVAELITATTKNACRLFKVEEL